jgi:hypothetical protein
MKDGSELFLRLVTLGASLVRTNPEAAAIVAEAAAEVERLRDRVESLQMVVAGNRSREIARRRRRADGR